MILQQGTIQESLKSVYIIYYKDNESNKKCNNIIAIIFNILTWTFLILIIICQKKVKKVESEDNSICYYILGSIFYFLYLAFELNSSTFKYLIEKKNKIFNERMGDIYRTNPTITILGKSYHIVTKAILNGGIINADAVTNEEKVEFKYKYCRDVSGTFNLNVDKKNYKYKYYVKLNIIYLALLDDTLTSIAYNNVKDNLISNIQHLDIFYRIDEIIRINGISNFNMIKLKEKDPFFVGCFWFIISTIFSLGILYKLYINIISIEQNILIKKLISNTNNIAFDPRYNFFNPELKIFDKTFTYEKITAIYNNEGRVLSVNENELSENNNSIEPINMSLSNIKNF